MNLLFLTHYAATWSLVGLIWTIQCVHYPLFGEVGIEKFPQYHRQHTRLITWIVAPLMAVELISALMIGMAHHSFVFRCSLVFLGVNWLSTGCIQIPLHNRLATGFEPRTHARLVFSNWLRTLAWSIRGVLLVWDVLR